MCAQSCPTLCNPLDHSPPSSCVHGLLQTRTLEWAAIPFSRESSPPRDQNLAPCITGRFCAWATGTSVGSPHHIQTNTKPFLARVQSPKFSRGGAVRKLDLGEVGQTLSTDSRGRVLLSTVSCAGKHQLKLYFKEHVKQHSGKLLSDQTEVK